MNHRIFFVVLLAATASFGAQGSGLFFDVHASRGVLRGDALHHFGGSSFGAIDGDSIRYLSGGKEHAAERHYTTTPVEFQYNVRYSFVAGYEKSFNKVLSLRGAIGYQNALMNAYEAIIPNYQFNDMTEVPVIGALIHRHWLSIPVDVKVMLPIRRSGIYVAAGPKASILLASNYEDTLNNVKQDLTGKTPRFNLGIGIRLGAEFPVGKIGHWFIESGYHKGLTNMAIVSSARTQEGEICLVGAGLRMAVPPVKDGGR